MDSFSTSTQESQEGNYFVTPPHIDTLSSKNPMILEKKVFLFLRLFSGHFGGIKVCSGNLAKDFRGFNVRLMLIIFYKLLLFSFQNNIIKCMTLVCIDENIYLLKQLENSLQTLLCSLTLFKTLLSFWF